MNMKESEEGYIGKVGGRKRKGKIKIFIISIIIIIISKIKEKGEWLLQLICTHRILGETSGPKRKREIKS